MTYLYKTANLWGYYILFLNSKLLSHLYIDIVNCSQHVYQFSPKKKDFSDHSSKSPYHLFTVLKTEVCSYK